MTTLSLRRVRRLPRLHLLLDRIAEANAVWRHRRTLRDLPDWALDDIGLTREEAQAEARRRIWDVPATWRR